MVVSHAQTLSSPTRLSSHSEFLLFPLFLDSNKSNHEEEAAARTAKRQQRELQLSSPAADAEADTMQ